MKLKLKLLSSVVIASAAVGFAAPSSPVPVTWLGGTPAPVAVGVSFGVPWPRGAVQKSQAFALTTADGKALPVQTWPLAFWPDGSLKWSGVATVAGPSTTGEFKLTATPSAAATDGAKISIRHSDTTYTIDTGRANFVIPMHGSNLIDAITVDQTVLTAKGKLGPVARLLPTTAATTLRKGPGEAIVLDGPFAETKESLLGFYVVDCENLDEVLGIARELAVANPGSGSYEIRPLAIFTPGGDMPELDLDGPGMPGLNR